MNVSFTSRMFVTGTIEQMEALRSRFIGKNPSYTFYKHGKKGTSYLFTTGQDTTLLGSCRETFLEQPFNGVKLSLEHLSSGTGYKNIGDIFLSATSSKPKKYTFERVIRAMKAGKFRW
ncbi:MAG: hypothetical protein PHC64_01275 [Candidatus Gastranaerophilales bacterium]|nr:hypothetical protein [Candidatus Gastranaerophilales bacterium]